MELTSRGKALVAYTIEEAKRGRTNTRYISKNVLRESRAQKVAVLSLE